MVEHDSVTTYSHALSQEKVIIFGVCGYSMREDQWQTGERTSEEVETNKDFFELFSSSPIPNGELLENLALYQNRQSLTRTVFMFELYKEMVDVQGDILEFGTRWGRDLVLFANFRGMLEPYNHTRKVVGFDTFEGFPESSITAEDGSSAESGGYNTVDGYEEHIRKVLEYHEEQSPISHKKKYEIVKGDVEETLVEYLEENPQTMIALAYFDLDLYSPTKTCLELIEDRIPRGGVVGFDELNTERFPGETEAVREVFGLDKFKIKRRTYDSVPSYMIKE